jgi:general secretion pathway protein D
LSFVEVTLAQSASSRPVRVTLDFSEVELPVFVRFISELTGKSFVLDEKVKGKVSLFSPTKVTVDQAYAMFLSALEVKRLMAVTRGDVIEIVQVGEISPERTVYVYKLKHATATEVAAVLTSLVARSLSPIPVMAGVLPLKQSSEFDGPVQVFSDKQTNSLIISASKNDYERIQGVIKALDTRRRQVFVEAVIMEVAVDRLRQIGVEPIQAGGGFKSGSVQGIAGVNRAPEEVVSLAQALSGIATGGATTAVPILNTLSVRLFLNFLMTQTDTNVLSTPQVMASDNQKARIHVGENRPFPTGQAQGITGGTVVTIERKDVGVTLELTPQVLENDLVKLEVKQEISSIAENVAQTIGAGSASVPVGPTTTKRAMETTAIAQDGQTLVIGGLVRDNVTVSEKKIPFLGDIPILGWLFRSQSKQTEKLSLLVFLTPHIIKDQSDMVQLNVRKGLEAATIQENSQVSDPTAVQRTIEELTNGVPRLSSPGETRGPAR